MKLDGKVAIVTGSARGIGEAIAKRLAAEGAAVVINARNAEGANRVAQEIQERGGKAIAIKADVSKKAEVEDMVRETLDIFGAIHILVNNAGIIRRGSMLEMMEEDWDIVQSVNLKGTFLCTQAVLGQMMKQRYGKVINISSVAALGVKTQAAYAAAKGGVISLTKVAAREAGPYGVNVNCIAAGRVITDLIYFGRTKEEADEAIEAGKEATILGRVGKPEDIANLAFFLASDDSSFMSGQIIRMDGGRGDLM